jgi:hypothetical protein
MAGLDPAIHVFVSQSQDEDARDKRGHDGIRTICARLVFFKLRRN